MKKYTLIGMSLIVIVLFVLSSFTNVAGYQTVQSPKDIPRLKIGIITDKKIYLDGSYLNATIIVTNKGTYTFEKLDLVVLLSQIVPSPRVQNDYSGGDDIFTLEPSESYQYKFSCKPYVMSNWHFGIFLLDVWINLDAVTIKHKIKFVIILC